MLIALDIILTVCICLVIVITADMILSRKEKAHHEQKENEQQTRRLQDIGRRIFMNGPG